MGSRFALYPNSSKDDSSTEGERLLFIIVVEVLFIFCACVNLLGNTLTICAVLRFQHLRSTVSNLFLVSLSAADLFAVPALLLFPLRNHGPMNSASILGHLVTVQWTAFISSHLSMLTLLLIAIDRLLAVTRGTKYKTLMTSALARKLIIGSWIYIVVLTGVSVLYFGVQAGPELLMSQRGYAVWMPPFAVYFLIVQIYVNVTLTSVIYVIIFVLLYKRSRTFASSSAAAVQPTNCLDLRLERNARRVKKVTKMMAFIVMVIVVTWLPVNIFTHVTSTSEPHYYIWYYCLHILMMTNTYINPLVYFWQNKDFRQAYVTMLRSRSCRNKVMGVEVEPTVVSRISA